MKYEIPVLETERLILKKGTYEDYVKVYEYDFTRLRNIAGEFEFIKNNPEKIIGFETYADEEENVLDFILYLKQNKEPIGNIVFDRYDDKKNSLDVSLNLHPDYWRKGYMTEALMCSMKYVFDYLEIDNIIYDYAEENYKSKGLSEKVGFEFYNDYMEHNTRLDKNVHTIKTIMTKEKFRKLHFNTRKNK